MWGSDTGGYFAPAKPDKELEGLVYGLTPLPSESHLPLFKRPIFWAVVIALALVIMNLIFA